MTTLFSSLFSIELYIDKLRLHKSVDCGFPSVIFKLLDFEPVQISTYHTDVIRKLKPLLEDKRFHGQIDELKDSDDNFVIRKGKSVLFPLEANVFVKYLHTVPLYLLVTDVLTDPSRLIGVCNIPLDRMSSEIFADISKNGVSIPSCREESGVYSLYSLMGHLIGVVSLKIRLMSIGPSILPHLPEENLLKVDKSLDRSAPKKPGECRDKEFESVIRSTKFSKDAQTDIKLEDIDSYIEEKKVEPSKRSRHQRIVYVSDPDLDADKERVPLKKVNARSSYNIGDVYEPPPLYYCSESRDDNNDKRMSTNYKSNIKKKSTKINTEINSEDIENEKFNQILQRVQNKENKTEQPSEELVTQLPLLNALLDELIVWKSHEDFSTKESDKPNSRDKVQPLSNVKRKPLVVRSTLKSRSASVPKPPRNIQNSETQKRGRSNSGFNNEWLERLATPRKFNTSKKNDIPRQVGWIRKEPEYKGPITSHLRYRITATHKRRLEKSNPKALNAILEQEAAQQNMNKTFCLDDLDMPDGPSPVVVQLKRAPSPPKSPKQRSNAKNFRRIKSREETISETQQYVSGDETELMKLKNESDDFDKSKFSTGSHLATSEGEDFVSYNPMTSAKSPQLSMKSVGGQVNGNGSISGSYPQPHPKSRRSITITDHYSDESASPPLTKGEYSIQRDPISNVSMETSEWRTSMTASPVDRDKSKRDTPRLSDRSLVNTSTESSPSHRDDRPPKRPDRSKTPPHTPPKSPVVRKTPLLSGGIMKGGRTPQNKNQRGFQQRSSSFDSTNGRQQKLQSGPTAQQTPSSGLSSSGNSPRLTTTGLMEASIESSPTKATTFTRVTKFDKSGVTSFGIGGMGTGPANSSILQTEDSISFEAQTEYNYASDEFEPESNN